MNKIALKKIGFVEQNEYNDVWSATASASQQNDRGQISIAPVKTHYFSSLAQSDAVLEETLSSDGSGSWYDQRLSFTVRSESDIALAKKYARRPVVIFVQAVDGSEYRIGSANYPAMMLTSNRYDALNVREVSVDVAYQSISQLL